MKLSSVAWVKIDEAVRRDDVGTLGELIFFREAWQRRDPRTERTFWGWPPQVERSSARGHC